jgi:hypothetical protein
VTPGDTGDMSRRAILYLGILFASADQMKNIFPVTRVTIVQMIDNWIGTH